MIRSDQDSRYNTYKTTHISLVCVNIWAAHASFKSSLCSTLSLLCWISCYIGRITTRSYCYCSTQNTRDNEPTLAPVMAWCSVRQQTITWANMDPDLCRSLRHNQLKISDKVEPVEGDMGHFTKTRESCKLLCTVITKSYFKTIMSWATACIESTHISVVMLFKFHCKTLFGMADAQMKIATRLLPSKGS